MNSLSLEHQPSSPTHQTKNRVVCSANKPNKPPPISKQKTHRRNVLLTTPLLCCGSGGFNNGDDPNSTKSSSQQRNSALDKMFAKAMFEGMADYEMAISPVKTNLFRQLKEDSTIKTVAEFGAGTGPNLPYYGKDTNLIAVDVNEFMRPYFQRNMDTFYWTPDRVKWVEASADDVTLENGSVDAVVCTLLRELLIVYYERVV